MRTNIVTTLISDNNQTQGNINKDTFFVNSISSFFCFLPFQMSHANTLKFYTMKIRVVTIICLYNEMPNSENNDNGFGCFRLIILVNSTCVFAIVRVFDSFYRLYQL